MTKLKSMIMRTGAQDKAERRLDVRSRREAKLLDNCGSYYRDAEINKNVSQL